MTFKKRRKRATKTLKIVLITACEMSITIYKKIK